MLCQATLAARLLQMQQLEATTAPAGHMQQALLQLGPWVTGQVLLQHLRVGPLVVQGDGCTRGRQSEWAWMGWAWTLPLSAVAGSVRCSCQVGIDMRLCWASQTLPILDFGFHFPQSRS